MVQLVSQTLPRFRIVTIAIIITMGLVLVFGGLAYVMRSKRFSGVEAFKQVEAQMAFGPRPPGSDANRKTGDFILGQLKRLGWQTETQEFTYHDTPVRNLLGKAAIG